MSTCLHPGCTQNAELDQREAVDLAAYGVYRASVACVSGHRVYVALPISASDPQMQPERAQRAVQGKPQVCEVCHTPMKKAAANHRMHPQCKPAFERQWRRMYRRRGKVA